MSNTADARPLRLAVLISGGGTTLRNLLACIAAKTLSAEVLLVISSTAKAGGLAIATVANIPTQVLAPRQFENTTQFSEAIFSACRAAKADLVVMAGFLALVKIPADFENRVVNIHPALVPAFSGHGFYGRHVHEAVLEHGAKVSGCTVHFVDDQFDHGPIILQKVVPVLDDDTPETLAARVFTVECEAYPEALRMIASGKVTVAGRRVQVRQ